jgi:hypothetical protein
MILKDAAAFLEKNKDLFPQGSLPTQPAQLAALAVRIYRLFSDMNDGTPDAVIAQAITTVLNEPEGH